MLHQFRDAPGACATLQMRIDSLSSPSISDPMKKSLPTRLASSIGTPLDQKVRAHIRGPY